MRISARERRSRTRACASNPERRGTGSDQYKPGANARRRCAAPAFTAAASTIARVARRSDRDRVALVPVHLYALRSRFWSTTRARTPHGRRTTAAATEGPDASIIGPTPTMTHRHADGAVVALALFVVAPRAWPTGTPSPLATGSTRSAVSGPGPASTRAPTRTATRCRSRPPLRTRSSSLSSRASCIRCGRRAPIPSRIRRSGR